MTGWHTYGIDYGNSTNEFILLGTAAGFYLPLGIDGNYVELENTGGDNWDLTARYNGIGIDTESFTHDFTTGLKDITFEWTPGDTYRQVITIIPYSLTRPDDLWNLPNRDVPELSIAAHYFGTLSTGNLQPLLLDDSTSDTDFQYYTTASGSTVDASIRKTRTPAAITTITRPFNADPIFSGGTVNSFQVVESPTHTFVTETPTAGATAYRGYVFEESDPPLMEKIEWRNLTDAEIDIDTYQPLYTAGRFYRLPVVTLDADLSADTALFDVSLIEDYTDAVYGSLGSPPYPTITDISITFALHYGYVRATCDIDWEWGGSPVSDIGSFPLPARFTIDGAGDFSGNLVWDSNGSAGGGDLINVPISGNIANANLRSDYWPHDDEEIIEPASPKVWFPEYFESEKTDATKDWALKKNKAATIQGAAVLLASTFSTSTISPYDVITATVAIDSGSIPTGMAINLPGSPALLAGTSGVYGDGRYNINITGTPTEDEDGEVQFKITIENNSITKVYKSRTFSWIVGTGTPVTFTLEYPSPFTNTATPPGAGFDWRIDGTTAVLTNYSITATVTGGTSPFTFSLHSGTLPPNALLNASTGAIYTTGINTLEPSETGSCVIKVVDDVADEAFSITYNWEYIG